MDSPNWSHLSFINHILSRVFLYIGSSNAKRRKKKNSSHSTDAWLMLMHDLVITAVNNL